MSETSRPAARRGVAAAVAVALVVVGAGLWVLYRILAGGGPHAYDPGAQAPYTVTLHAGSTYRIAIPGGRSAAPVTVSADALQCSVVTASGTRALTVQGDSTKATDALGVFVSPVGGKAHVQCTGLSSVFVTGDDEGFDTAGLLLVLATIALVVGVPLMLSVLRAPARA